jgi:hypothetical protein
VTTAIGASGLAAGGTAGALLGRELAGTAAAGLPLGALVLGSGVAALVLSAGSRVHGRSVWLAAGYLAGALGAAVVVAAAVSGSLFVELVGSGLMGAASAAVFLTRYAAVEFADPALRGRALGVIFIATSIGATASPLLLQPSGTLAQSLGLPVLAGAYLTAGAAFATAGLLLLAFAPEPSPPQPISPGVARIAPAPVATLAAANFVMVAVMTVAPLCLFGNGVGLTTVDVGIALHVACMFAPAPLSVWLADHHGSRVVVQAGFAQLAAAALMAVVLSGGDTLRALLVLIPLGSGWNFCVVGGTVAIAAASPDPRHAQAEGVGEAAMAAAASVAAPLSGVVVGCLGFRSLAAVCVLIAVANVAAMTTASAREVRSCVRRADCSTTCSTPTARAINRKSI